MSVKRDELLRLLTDVLAIDTAAQLGLTAIPGETVLRPIRVQSSAAAEKLLATFEQELTIHAVKDIIVNDVRLSLLRRTRLTKSIEWAVALTTIAATVAVSAGQFVFIEPPNIEGLVAMYWVCLGFMSVSALGFLYLKLVDIR